MDYFAETGHIDKVQREEMQSLGAHPSVIAEKDNVSVSCEFNFSLVSQQSVKEALSLLDPKKATGCDGITSEFLKMNAEQLQSLPKLLKKNRIFSHFSSPSPLQCWFLVRLRSALGHKQAAESLSFKSGDHSLGPTLFRGAGGAEKSKR